MRFAILGAGALGSILGAHLSRAGHEVAMIARGERARVLQRQGLVLNGLSDIKARCAVVDDPRKLLETDTLIIATKAIDTAQSLDAFKHLKLETAFSVQNGVLKNELLARVWGFSRVLGAMADFSGELLANGEVKFTRNVALHIGEEKGGLSPRVETLAKLIDTRRRALRRCARHPHARVVEVRGLDRAVSRSRCSRGRSPGNTSWTSAARCVIVRIVREAAALAAALKIELADMPPLPVPSIVRASEAEAIDIIAGDRSGIPREVARTPHVGTTGCAARQPARVRGDAGFRAAEGARAGRRDADARYLLPHRRGGHMGRRPHEMGTVPMLSMVASDCFPRVAAGAAGRPATLFTDDFESRAAGVAPTAPWKEESYNTGVTIRVDTARAFSRPSGAAHTRLRAAPRTAAATWQST